MRDNVLDRALSGEWMRGDNIRLFAEEYVKRFSEPESLFRREGTNSKEEDRPKEVKKINNKKGKR